MKKVLSFSALFIVNLALTAPSAFGFTEKCFDLNEVTVRVSYSSKKISPKDFLYINSVRGITMVINGIAKAVDGKPEGLLYDGTSQEVLGTNQNISDLGYFTVDNSNKTSIQQIDVKNLANYKLVIGSKLTLVSNSKEPDALAKSTSIKSFVRSAIGEKNGEICFAVSEDEKTLKDWAQELIDQKYEYAYNLSGDAESGLAYYDVDGTTIKSAGKLGAVTSIIYVDKKDPCSTLSIDTVSEVERQKENNIFIALSKTSSGTPKIADSDFTYPLIPLTKNHSDNKIKIREFFDVCRDYDGQEKYRAIHNGLDLVETNPGYIPKVVAPAAGKVIEADLYELYGNVVVIDHGSGLISVLAHLDSSSVKKGDVVAKGEKIGVMGKTGKVGGIHVHWSLIQDGTFINPEFVIPVANLAE